MQWIEEGSSVLLIFVIITVSGTGILYFMDERDWLPRLISAVDTGSAVALAVLAFFGYKKYVKEQDEKKKYEKTLKEISKNDIDGNEAAFLVQFGGQSDMLGPMEAFLEKKKFKGKIIKADHFGDDEYNVEEEDIRYLVDYCKKIRPTLSSSSKVHVLYGGTAIGYAVIADILSNATTLVYYHKAPNGYQPWYTDVKSASRNPECVDPLA